VRSFCMITSACVCGSVMQYWVCACSIIHWLLQLGLRSVHGGLCCFVHTVCHRSMLLLSNLVSPMLRLRCQTTELCWSLVSCSCSAHFSSHFPPLPLSKSAYLIWPYCSFPGPMGRCASGHR
jgi:hypothetical protein